MSEQWGTTGRVTLDGDLSTPGADAQVLVDRKRVGWVGAPDERDPSWWARADARIAESLPSRDAAVMHVLRRAAPKIWAAERPVVYHTMRTTYDAVPNAARVAQEFARATYVARARSAAPTSPPVAPEYWTKRQVAEYAGLAERSIHNYVLRGELTAYRVGARAVRFLRSDVEALFAPRVARSAVTA